MSIHNSDRYIAQHGIASTEIFVHHKGEWFSNPKLHDSLNKDSRIAYVNDQGIIYCDDADEAAEVAGEIERMGFKILRSNRGLRTVMGDGSMGFIQQYLADEIAAGKE